MLKKKIRKMQKDLTHRFKTGQLTEREQRAFDDDMSIYFIGRKNRFEMPSASEKAEFGKKWLATQIHEIDFMERDHAHKPLEYKGYWLKKILDTVR